MWTLIAWGAAKVLPATINSVFQMWVQEKINKNRPDIVQNQEARNRQADEDRFIDLERRAALGDKQAQEEIRARNS